MSVEARPINVQPNGVRELPDDYSKVCKTCGEEKPASEFYDHPTNGDRLFHHCKGCTNEKRRKKYENRKELDCSHLDRVDKFVQGYLDPSELADDEVVGNFIRDDQGKPVRTIELRQRFHAKFTKELSKRINNFLREKAPSAVEIVYQIASNDLYEAADRLKAATWLAERVIGKTPDVVIHGEMDKPYVGILDSVTSGPRQAYREMVDDYERNGGGGELEIGDIIDAEVEGEEEDPGESSDLEESETSGEGVESEFENNGESGNSRVLDRANQIADDRAERLERAKKIRKAKQRRYAARAVGATSLSQQPWLVEFKRIRGSTGYKLRLIPPDQQTPAIVDRILRERSWQVPTDEEVEARRKQAADEKVAMIEAQLERLEQQKESA